MKPSISLDPFSIGKSDDEGVGLQLTKGTFDDGQWRIGVGLGGEKGPSFGLQWKKLF